MKLNIDDFKILVDSPSQGGNGKGQKGPDNIENISKEKPDSEPGNDDENDGENDNDSSGDNKGSGKSSVKVEDISKRGIGGILSKEESKKMQEDLGVTYKDAPSENEIKERLKDMLPSLDRGARAKSQGGGAGNQKRLLSDAVYRIVRPIVDWKNVLKKFIGRCLSRKEEDILPNRRYVAGGEYYHGSKNVEENLNTCVIAVDTSGSMSNRELLVILNEIKGIAQLNKINNFEIVYFDDGIRGIEKMRTEKIKSYNPDPPGGGGTTFKEPLAYMDKVKKAGKMDLAIFVTDGYADLNIQPPRFKDKFIWVILNNPSFNAPWGNKVVFIDTNNQ